MNPGQLYVERLERFKYDDLQLEYKILFDDGVVQRPWLGFDYELVGKRIRLWKDVQDVDIRGKIEEKFGIIKLI